jgi:hypothetical protein
VVVGSDGGVTVVRGSIGRRVAFGKLGRGAGAETERQRECEERKTQEIFHGRLKG